MIMAHGIRNSYVNRGCRCDLCTEANRMYHQERRSRDHEAYLQYQRDYRQRHPQRKRDSEARRRASHSLPFTGEQLDQRLSMWGFLCWMCGGAYEEVDHVIPIALGGPHCLANLRPACRGCNASKGARRVA